MTAKTVLCLSTLLGCAALSAMPPSCRPADSFEQGYELKQNQMMAAYNATARIDVRGSWDLYTTGGYIYWQPREENLDLGITSTTALIALPITGRVVNMPFQYKSGFKAGIGIFTDRDNWDAYGEYTWLAGHHSVHATAPTDGSLVPFWGHPANFDYTVPISSGSGRWFLEMNLGDVELARSYYLGTKLTCRPFVGARVAFINQKYKAIYNAATTTHIHNSSHSWGLGPRVGMGTNWLLGYGIRAIGSAELDVLYTRYNIHERESDYLTPTTDNVSLYQRHVFFLRPHTDLELGFGWGSYFSNHNYHFDLMATYGFQVFWNQNMFRNFVDNIAVGKSTVSNGDLYIHGVTGEVRLDF